VKVDKTPSQCILRWVLRWAEKRPSMATFGGAMRYRSVDGFSMANSPKETMRRSGGGAVATYVGAHNLRETGAAEVHRYCHSSVCSVLCLILNSNWARSREDHAVISHTRSTDKPSKLLHLSNLIGHPCYGSRGDGTVYVSSLGRAGCWSSAGLVADGRTASLWMASERMRIAYPLSLSLPSPTGQAE